MVHAGHLPNLFVPRAAPSARLAAWRRSTHMPAFKS